MGTTTCPIQSGILELNHWLSSSKLDDPKGMAITGNILGILEAIASGKANTGLFKELEVLTEAYGFDCTIKGNIEIQKYLQQFLADHREVILSHMESRNCPTGDCVKLAMSPCQVACPAGIDIPSYISLIGRGEDALAMEVIRKDNPLPWICGLVCTKPCESKCVRARIDTPVSIKYLKAFAAKKAMALGTYTNPEQRPLNGKKVCVVGAGPAGLSCAYYLALEGYKVKVIESLPVPGGMLMVGIPRYRLPLDVIDKEVDMIRELGVEFSFNTRFGTDISLDTLKKDGFEAFFLAIGAHKSWALGIDGENSFPKVLDAVTFLKDAALGDKTIPGRNVVVIGGGNVAIDAARTSLRLGAESVTIAYRRSETEMPADIEEIEHAREEGILFSFLTIPIQIRGEDTTITELGCVKAELVKKEGTKRLSPVPIQGGEFSIPADAVIPAIGQYVDDKGFEAFNDISWSRNGTFEVNSVTLQTSDPSVFAAGDAVTGPATVIQAIAGGKQAARSIDRYFKEEAQPQLSVVPRRREKISPIELSAEEKITLKRPQMQMLDMDSRQTTFDQVETGYYEKSVREEAARCLRCDICRRCQKCVEICRDEMGVSALQFGYMDDEHTGNTDFGITKEKCIACGACAENCENNAIVLEERDDKRVLHLCGTILNEQKILRCSDCNASLPPQVYTDFISKRTVEVSASKGTQLLCHKCRRQAEARQIALPFSS